MFPAEPQPRYTYRLWHIFYYPTAHGHEAAFAVTKSWGDSINSIYTVLLEIILAQAFQFFVLAFVYIGNRSSSDLIHLATKVFSENEPTAVLLRVLSGLFGRNSVIKGYKQTMMFMVVGLTILFVPKLVPASAIHSLLIGSAAPVNPAQIYVLQSPWLTRYDVGLQIPLEALSQPKFLRAVGQYRLPVLICKTKCLSLLQ